MSNRIRPSAFARNVAALVSGSVVAQAISVAGSPILTRLYAPESFAALALFMALASPFLPAMCGRYDMAIVLASSRKEGQHLVGLALRVSCVLSSILLLVAIVFYQPVMEFLNAGALGHWLLLVPIFLFVSSVTTALRYFSNLNEDYNIMSKIVVFQAIFTLGINITLSVIGVQTFGLLMGNIFGVLLSSIWLISYYRRIFNIPNMAWGKRKIAIARKYRDFPLFSASTSILDGLAVALPVFFLAKYYSENTVGYYALLTRVAQAPLSFISGAVSQVHLKKVRNLIQSNESVSNYLTKITLSLFCIVALPTVILMTWGPELFAWVFGETWRTAGELLVILMPALSLRFVVSTVSGTLPATGHLRLGSVWQILSLGCTFAMFSLLAPRLDINEMFVSMLVTDIFLYLVYAYFIWHAAKYPNRRA